MNSEKVLKNILFQWISIIIVGSEKERTKPTNSSSSHFLRPQETPISSDRAFYLLFKARQSDYGNTKTAKIRTFS